jgi:hypothetical protein
MQFCKLYLKELWVSNLLIFLGLLSLGIQRTIPCVWVMETFPDSYTLFIALTALNFFSKQSVQFDREI